MRSSERTGFQPARAPRGLRQPLPAPQYEVCPCPAQSTGCRQKRNGEDASKSEDEGLAPKKNEEHTRNESNDR